MRFLCALLLIFATIAATSSAHAADNIAVMELFSSTSCQDAPNVDANFNKIASQNHKNLITLNCHVTYFEDQWKSSTEREFCDYRHNQYMGALDSMFMDTPHIVINGRFETSGKNEKTLNDAITMGHTLDQIRPIDIDQNNDAINISLTELRLEEHVDVWLFAYDKRKEVIIEDGPLAGSKPLYINLVTHTQKLLEWKGAYRNLSIERNMFPADGYAVIAQNPKTMEILAAGRLEID